MNPRASFLRTYGFLADGFIECIGPLYSFFRRLFSLIDLDKRDKVRGIVRMGADASLRVLGVLRNLRYKETGRAARVDGVWRRMFVHFCKQGPFDIIMLED